MGSTKRNEVLVVGGGVIGCAAARELAADHDLRLLESAQIAGDASGKASGLITNAASFRAHPAFARTAAEFFPAFDGTGSFSFTDRESVGLVPAGGAAGARAEATRMGAAGFEVEFVDVGTLHDRYPGVFAVGDAGDNDDGDESYDGALVYHDTGWLDPYTYTTTLADAAADRGADIETGVTVTGLVVEGEEVRGVETTAGAYRAETVVVAAGWRARELCLPHLELPVRPLRWQAATLRPGTEIPEWYPMGWDPTIGRYWRPEHNGDLHVGGDERAVESPGAVRSGVTASFKLGLAADMPDRLSHLRDAEFVRGDTCPTGDATTPDTYPIIDAPEDGPDGLVVATGFHIGGVMCSPAVAQGVRALVTGDDLGFPLSPFSLSRFETRSGDFPFVSHMEESEHTEARIEGRVGVDGGD